MVSGRSSGKQVMVEGMEEEFQQTTGLNTSGIAHQIDGDVGVH